jgi:hypothetical protein
MKWSIYSLIIGVLILTAAQPAFAQRGGSPGRGAPGFQQRSFSGKVAPNSRRPAHVGQHKKANPGKGVRKSPRAAGLPRGFRGFDRRSYSSRYRCALWRGPGGVWYYWCGPQGCYLPTSYIDEYPPDGDDPDEEDAPGYGSSGES